MLLATVAEVHRNGIKVVPEFYPALNREDRIIEAFGPLGGYLSGVDEETLSRYYTYLTARLSFPFTAYYPEPTTTLEKMLHRCTVVELLDPANDICDELGGIFCKTRNGKYEINFRTPDIGPLFPAFVLVSGIPSRRRK